MQSSLSASPALYAGPSLAGPRIVLTTLNAKYIHASLGLRYLLANMGELRDRTALLEFTIARPPEAIVADLLTVLQSDEAEGQKGQACPIVGFGVYIWNVRQTAEVVRLLRARLPRVKIVLGGPEVSYETGEQEIATLADYVITGWGDVSFARLCRDLWAGRRPLNRIIAGEQPPLAELNLPYAEYTDSDLAHRLLYVEASRGCPFKCEFCLSALDKTAWPFELEAFLAQMQRLYTRGARHFKFVDRTFNLKVDTSIRILEFFLARLAENPDALFVHFELVPDHLPERLRAVIARFPAGVLQFEVGIQSFNTDVQARISRRQDNAKTEENLRWLMQETHAHIHADLIFGLPGETLESFAAGFDRLYSIGPHEIQLGVLKRLRGTPIARHSEAWRMVYDPEPPYVVRETAVLDTATVQAFQRFSRYWDYLANSGRFPRTLRLLLTANTGQPGTVGPEAAQATSPFYRFWALSTWLWARLNKTHGLSPELLVDQLWDYLHGECGLEAALVRQALVADYVASGARSQPVALRGFLPRRGLPEGEKTQEGVPGRQAETQDASPPPQAKRQGRHRRSG